MSSFLAWKLVHAKVFCGKDTRRQHVCLGWYVTASFVLLGVQGSLGRCTSAVIVFCTAAAKDWTDLMVMRALQGISFSVYSCLAHVLSSLSKLS